VSRARTAAVALGLAAALTTSCGSDDDVATVPIDAPDEPTPDAAPAPGDGLPTGAISYFLATFCPAGWSPYSDAVGRTIVPSAGADAGAAVGNAWAANEQRAHRHDLAVGVDLPSVSYVGIAGGGNNGVTRSGRIDATAVTDDAGDTLPYAQLLVCRKTASAGGRPPPPGVIAFFADATCPPSWIEAPSELQGRFVVALPAGGTSGQTFGGEPLAPGEIRTHTHPVTASVTAGSHGIGLAGGCCAGGYGGAGTHTTATTAVAAATEVPYLQLLACVAPAAN